MISTRQPTAGRDSRASELAGEDHLPFLLEQIEAHLIRFLARDKASALGQAVARRARELVEEGLLRLRLVARSLELDEEELAERRRLGERLELAVSVTEGAVRSVADHRRERAAEVAQEKARVAATVTRLEELGERLPTGPAQEALDPPRQGAVG